MMGTHLLKFLALLLQLLQGPEPAFLRLQVREDMTVEAGERWGSEGSVEVTRQNWGQEKLD